MNRFAEPIERDLAERGQDLVTLFRRRRWRFLLNLVDGLPRNTAYGDALAQDEQLAEQALDNPPPPGAGAGGLRMAEYSPELEMLTNVFDRLGDLIQATIAAQGGKAPKVKPYPRPKTALDRVKEQRRLAKHRRIVARVLSPRDGIPAPATPPPPPTPDRPPLLPGEDPFSFVPSRHR